MSLFNRGILDQELTAIQNYVLRLSSMVETAIDQAMEALFNSDLALAQTVVDNDEAINKLRYEIEEECLRILATQQPMASDLRTIIAVIHITVELERIADHAAGTARLVERLTMGPDIISLHKLPKMAKRAKKMLQEGMRAFVERDPVLAEKLIKRDEKIDQHYAKLFVQSIKEMQNDDYIQSATYLLWIGHNLERIGDRTTNVAERVIFMTTGELREVHTS